MGFCPTVHSYDPPMYFCKREYERLAMVGGRISVVEKIKPLDWKPPYLVCAGYGKPLFLAHNYWDNICHWLCDIYHDIIIYRNITGNVPKVVTRVPRHNLREFNITCIERIGSMVADVSHHDDAFKKKDYIMYDCSYVVNPQRELHHAHPSAIYDVKGELERLFTKRVDPMDAVFVERTIKPGNKYSRTLQNKDELLAILKKLGIRATVIRFEEHPIEDQIAIAKSAKMFIGVHGAALALSMFCDKSPLIEIASPFLSSNYFHDLSSHLGRPYIMIDSEYVDGERGRTNNMLKLDPELFATAVRKVMRES